MAGAAAAGLLIIGVPVTALGLAGTFSSASVRHNAPMSTFNWVAAGGSASPVPVGSRHRAQRGRPPGDYDAYVAFAGGYEVVEVDVATDTIIGTISDDTGEGVAVTPDDSTVYIADTGQYYVLAVNTATKAETSIEVGRLSAGRRGIPERARWPTPR